MEYAEFSAESEKFRPSFRLTQESRLLAYDFGTEIQAAVFRSQVHDAVEDLAIKVPYNPSPELVSSQIAIAEKFWNGSSKMMVIANNDEAYFLVCDLAGRAGRRPLHQMRYQPAAT